MEKKKKIHRVQVTDHDLYQLLLMEERYSFSRDNGCVTTFKMHVENYLPKMEEEFRQATAQQLIEEIISALNLADLYGARKHKAYYKQYRDVQYPDGTVKNELVDRVAYLSDYEIESRKLISAYCSCKFEDLTIESSYSFADEEDWRKLIIYLKQFVSDGYKPYNYNGNENLFDGE